MMKKTLVTMATVTILMGAGSAMAAPFKLDPPVRDPKPPISPIFKPEPIKWMPGIPVPRDPRKSIR